MYILENNPTVVVCTFFSIISPSDYRRTMGLNKIKIVQLSVGHWTRTFQSEAF
jgi:hypothetical protein